MFDRVTVQSPRSVHHSHHSEVHEHRAPTDESVRLLKEMQEAALQSVVASGKLENNLLTGEVTVVRECFGMENTGIIRLKINGQDIEVRVDLSPKFAETAEEARKKLVEGIVKGLMRSVGEVLMQDRLFRGEFITRALQ